MSFRLIIRDEYCITHIVNVCQQCTQLTVIKLFEILKSCIIVSIATCGNTDQLRTQDFPGGGRRQSWGGGANIWPIFPKLHENEEISLRSANLNAKILMYSRPIPRGDTSGNTDARCEYNSNRLTADKAVCFCYIRSHKLLTIKKRYM